MNFKKKNKIKQVKNKRQELADGAPHFPVKPIEFRKMSEDT